MYGQQGPGARIPQPTRTHTRLFSPTPHHRRTQQQQDFGSPLPTNPGAGPAAPTSLSSAYSSQSGFGGAAFSQQAQQPPTPEPGQAAPPPPHPPSPLPTGPPDHEPLPSVSSASFLSTGGADGGVAASMPPAAAAAAAAGGGVDLLDFVLVAGDERTDEDMFDVLRVRCFFFGGGAFSGGGYVCGYWVWVLMYVCMFGCGCTRIRQG